MTCGPRAGCRASAITTSGNCWPKIPLHARLPQRDQPRRRGFDRRNGVIGRKSSRRADSKAASLRILLSETSLEALDANAGSSLSSPAPSRRTKQAAARTPHRQGGRSQPDYTFDPALFADAAKAEASRTKWRFHRARNPVGTTWIGLSLPGYGIHGTPDPENISRTQSHAAFVSPTGTLRSLKMVRVGTPVDVEP